MTNLINDIYAVEVPDPGNAIVSGNVITWKKGDAQGRGFIALPAGNWQLICTTKECTEEQAKTIVGSSEWYFPVRHTRYIDYTKPYDRENKQRWSEGFGSALGSIVSLFESNNLDPNKNYVLIKKAS